ncbi:MAG: AAA family ATPase [Deltaproteobacteria bacterium]|jgi:hypothetical protein|nr:AAA family ATPase [Deltaproteobacteria bacterium]
MANGLASRNSRIRVIDNNFLYLEKTRYVYTLAQNKNTELFLSRPRRFGKTLLLDTLKDVFRATGRVFESLWIDSADYDWPKSPAIFLSLSMEAPIPEILWNNILVELRRIAEPENLTIEADSPVVYFDFIIEARYHKAKAEAKSKVKAVSWLDPNSKSHQIVARLGNRNP